MRFGIYFTHFEDICIKDNLHFHHLYARAILRSILALYQHLVVVVVVCCARLASPGPGTTEDVSEAAARCCSEKEEIVKYLRQFQSLQQI